MSTEKETTEVSQVEVNLDELLGIPGADNVMLPEEKKPSVFTDPKVDTSFLDTPDEEDEEKEKTISKTEVDNLLDEPLKDEDADDAPKATGRPKLDKSGTAELVKKLIDKGQIVPFDDDKPIEEYTLKDFESAVKRTPEAEFRTKRTNAWVSSQTPR